MTLIVFKDEKNKPVAISSTSIVKVDYVAEDMSEITYRIGDDIFSANVSHPVLEVVEAINKVTGAWL